MAGHQCFHAITIACEPDAVFDYITAPDRWHEWLPVTLSVPPDPDAQTAGATFELFRKRSLVLAAFGGRRSLSCRVNKSDRPYLWEVDILSNRLEATTSCTLSHSEEGTILKCQFRYAVRGWARYLEPIVLRRRIVRKVRNSLEHISRKLDCGSGQAGR